MKKALYIILLAVELVVGLVSLTLVTGVRTKRMGEMNRNTFVFLMVIEGFFAMAAMGLLFSDMGAIIYLFAAVVFSAVLAPFAIRLKKEADEAKKRKIRRNMALVLLIPIVIAAIAAAAVVTALMIYFSA